MINISYSKNHFFTTELYAKNLNILLKKIDYMDIIQLIN